MLNFSSDYLQGTHPAILKELEKTNYEKTTGYYDDIYCDKAKELILKECNCPNGEVFFFVGGTITNLVVISSLLKSYQGVISADSGHISVHEAGAIELGGHKVLTIKNIDGKLKAKDIKQCVDNYNNDGNKDHMVMPGMVYISQPTEIGTIYSYQELKDISDICKEYDLPLYIDGARLGYALATPENDLSMEEICKLCDAFYIGGTKVGALFGEALVFRKKNYIPHFFTIIKQHGAVLAKGRLLGIQFLTLFTNNLYYEISKNAIITANLLKEGLIKKGYQFYFNSPTNQIFVIIDDEKLKGIKDKVIYGFWDKVDNKTIVRFATSWVTTKNDVLELLEIL